jgi:phytoene dehydrogenase-like protein
VNVDAVVIGASADGLVAAHYLARAGRRVVVLDQRADADRLPDEGWIPPRIVRELELDRQGLRIDAPDPWLTVPLPDGGRLDLTRDVNATAFAIRQVSPHDADRWPEFCERMARLAQLLEWLYVAPPPDPMEPGLRGAKHLASAVWRVRGLGKQGIVDLARALPMSIGELLDDWFESDWLKGALGAAGVRHVQQGPRSGGTAFVLLHHHAGSPPGVFRSPRSNLSQVLRSVPGVEVRRGPDAEVAQITVRGDRVMGVVLKEGGDLAARLVVSAEPPRRTLLDWLDPALLDPELARAVRNVRRRGVSARVMLRLDHDPGFGTFVVAPSLTHLERAYDGAKYGWVSEAPYLEARYDASRSDGAHDVDVHVQYAPYALADGTWDDARREHLGDMCVAALAERIPNLRDCVTGRTVLAPPDLEQRYGWPEGQPYHAELALDQALYMRPIPQLAQYRAPVQGLYLCGPGMHPGGIPGAAGANAAGVILAPQPD